MFEFKLDNKKKTASIKVLLKGETEPLEVHIKRYGIVKDSEVSASLRIEEAVSNKPWLNAILQNFKTKISEFDGVKIPTDKVNLLDELLD